MFKFWFKKDFEEERAEVQTETLYRFCYLKYRTVFGLDRKNAKRNATLLVNDWVRSGKTDKRINMMWRQKF